MIFAADISTTCIGITFLNNDGSLFFMNHLSFDDCDSLYIRTEKFKCKLQELKEKNNSKLTFEHIFIEEPKKSFARQKTSNNTLTKLTSFNAMCSYMLYSEFGVVPIHINESTARKKCGLKILSKKKCGVGQKEQAFEQMKLREPFINYEWDMKRTGRVKDYHLDEMDSFIVAKAGFNSL